MTTGMRLKNDKRLVSMTYWWPRVLHIPVALPQTILVDVSEHYSDLWAVLDGKGIPSKVVKAVGEVANTMGWPIFLRGDLTSGKHEGLLS